MANLGLRFPAASLIFIACVAGWFSAAANSLFLKIPGAPGESTDALHAGEIRVYSWSLGASKLSMVPPSWMDLAIRKPEDKASPKLMESLCTGKYFSNAVLTITAPDGTDISRIELTAALVTSMQVDASGGMDGADESISLAFERIKIEYVYRAPDGKPMGKTGSEWNLESNTGSVYGGNFIYATLSATAGSSAGQLSWTANPGKTYQVLATSVPGPEAKYSLFTTVSSGENSQITIPVPLDKARLFFKIQEL